MALAARHLPARQGGSQIAVVVAGAGLYELLRLAIHPDWPLAVNHAHEVLGWERGLHLAWEAPLQRAFLRLPALVEGMNVFYLAANVVVTGAFFAWLYRRSRPAFLVYRNAFVLATALALLIEWRFPTAPPRLAGVGIEDTLRRLSGIDIGSSGSGGITDPVAAVPSLHAGWALGVAVGLRRHCESRVARLLALVYALGVDLTVIVTGNHFVFDVLVGSAIVVGGLALVAAVSAARVIPFVPRRGVEQSGSSPGS